MNGALFMIARQATYIWSNI